MLWLRRILMIALPAVFLGAGGYGAWYLIQSREEPERKPVEVPPPLVRVMEAQPKTVTVTVKAQGTVSARTESDLVPEISGRVTEISSSLAPGGFFEKGEVMLRIDPREYELAVTQARAAVAQAELRLATEREEAEVARREWEELGQGEPSPLALREPQLEEARAALASAKAALERAEYDLERTVLRAPYSGRVREKLVDVGQYVQRGAPIARIYAVDVAEVRLPIPDEDTAFVNLPLSYRGDDAGPARGPRVTLRSEFGGKTHEWQGRIVRTEGQIDPRTRMIHVVARVEDPYGRAQNSSRPPLAVGMFVEAEIEGKTVPGVFDLPRSVLRGQSTVMVVDDENRLHFREVEIYRAETDRVLIRRGLSAGDRICLSKIETAVNGMKVEVIEREGEDSPALAEM